MFNALYLGTSEGCLEAASDHCEMGALSND